MILSCNEMCHCLCWLASLFFEKHLSYSKSLTWQATAANVHTRSWSKCTAICCPVGNCQWLLWSHSLNVWWLVVAKFSRQKVFLWAFCWYHISCSMSPRVQSSSSERASVQLATQTYCFIAHQLEGCDKFLEVVERVKGMERDCFSAPWPISFWWTTLLLSPMHLFQIYSYIRRTRSSPKLLKKAVVTTLKSSSWKYSSN